MKIPIILSGGKVMAKKKISIKDVAKHAGVGLGTVSRAINNKGSISPKTKAKVLQSIKELGYTPNRLAQSMRSNKYKNIAFFVDLSNPTFSRIAVGLFNQLEKHGYTLSLCHIGKENIVNTMESFLSGRLFDGIILAPHRDDDEDLNQYLHSLDIPIVILEHEIPGFSSGVEIDYYHSVKQAMAYLFSLGHHQIALLTGSSHVRSNKSIIKSYMDAYEERNLKPNPDLIMQGNIADSYHREAMEKIVEKVARKEITALLCMHNQILHLLLDAMKNKQLWFPQDVSLIAVEDYELTQLLNPSVTVIKRSLTSIGEKMADLLVTTINHPNFNPIPPQVIPTQFIIRESCRPL